MASPGYLAVAGAPALPAELAAHNGLSCWREASDDLWVLAGAGISAVSTPQRLRLPRNRVLLDFLRQPGAAAAPLP